MLLFDTNKLFVASLGTHLRLLTEHVKKSLVWIVNYWQSKQANNNNPCVQGLEGMDQSPKRSALERTLDFLCNHEKCKLITIRHI